MPTGMCGWVILRELIMNKLMKTTDRIKVRACSIRCKTNPEWGTFGVMEDNGSYYSIFNRGWRVLTKQEANEFWEVVHGGNT